MNRSPKLITPTREGRRFAGPFSLALSSAEDESAQRGNRETPELLGSFAYPAETRRKRVFFPDGADRRVAAPACRRESASQP